MNTKLLKSSIWICLIIIHLTSFQAMGKGGSMVGGGGDGSEDRFNEIRADLLKWVNLGGAKELDLPKEISYGEYVDKMTTILENKIVVVGFTNQDVLVNNAQKTCKGFFSDEDSKFHILCNIARFNSTKDAEQYRLVHHEFAGLVGVEKNEDAASDYEVSNQISDFLTEQTVLKLAVKKANKVKCNISLHIEYGLIIESDIQLKLAKILIDKGYVLSSDNADIDINLYQSDVKAKRSAFCEFFNDSKRCISNYATAAINYKTKDFFNLPLLKANDERVLHAIENSYANAMNPHEIIGLSSEELSTDYLTLIQKTPTCDEFTKMRSQCVIINGVKVCDGLKLK